MNATNEVWSPNDQVHIYFRNETIGGYVPLGAQIIYFTYVALIFILGIPGNLTIVIVYAKTKPKKACDWFILFIGVTDFVVSVVSPGLCVHMELGLEVPYINNLLCGFEHLWQLAAMSASCFIFTLMSIERYIRVCRPTMKSFTPIMSRNTSIMCILFAVVISTYPTYRQFSKNTCYHWDTVESVPVENMYAYFVCFCFCFFTVSVAYGCVIHTIEEKIKVKQRLMENSGLHEGNGSNLKGGGDQISVLKEEKPAVCDDISDKHDSGFNQIETKEEEAHGGFHGDNIVLAKSMNSITPQDRSLNDCKETQSDPSRINRTGLAQEEKRCDRNVTENPVSVKERINSKPAEAELKVGLETAQINITVNPLKSHTDIFSKDESDTDNPDVNETANKLNGLNEIKQPSLNQNQVMTNNKVSNDNELSPSFLKPHTFSKPRGKIDPNSLAVSDFDYVEDDLYSDIVQPRTFFIKAKQSIHEIKDKISHVKKRSSNSRRKRWIRERQVTMMLFCVTIVFLGTWIPPWILYLMASNGYFIFSSGIPTRIIHRYLDKIYLLNYVLNFPVYYRFNSTFRTKAKAVIPKWVLEYCMCWCIKNEEAEV